MCLKVQNIHVCGYLLSCSNQTIIIIIQQKEFIVYRLSKTLNSFSVVNYHFKVNCLCHHGVFRHSKTKLLRWQSGEEFSEFRKNQTIVDSKSTGL